MGRWINGNRRGEEHPKAKGAFLVYPSYHGFCPPLAPLIDLIKAQGKLVLVDEAHGPHFTLKIRVCPRGPWSLGPTWWPTAPIRSWGPSPKAPFLHVQGKSPERLGRALELLLSTSPSPLLLASLDGARAQMEEGERLWDRALNLARMARERIEKLPGLSLLGPDTLPKGTIAAFDPTKLAVSIKDPGSPAGEAAAFLRRCGVQVEMADWWTVLCLLTYADGHAEVDALASGFAQLSAAPPSRWRSGGEEARWGGHHPSGHPAPHAFSPGGLFSGPGARCPWSGPWGRIAAEIIAPYPPGSPVIIPGEVFTEEVLDYLELLRSFQVKVRGVDDPSLAEVAVVA